MAQKGWPDNAVISGRRLPPPRPCIRHKPLQVPGLSSATGDCVPAATAMRGSSLFNPWTYR